MKWLHRLIDGYRDDGFWWIELRLWPSHRRFTFGWRLEERFTPVDLPVPSRQSVHVGFEPNEVLFFSSSGGPPRKISADEAGFTIKGDI